MVPSAEIESAYRYCEQLAKSHYENFPVASVFLKKTIRRPITVLYAFARTADDIADEGTLSPSERLFQLQQYWDALEQLKAKKPVKEPIFIALSDVLRLNPHLPLSPLFDLLRAFKQDVLKKEYQNSEELLAYCAFSANPIGQLLLHLHHQAHPLNLEYANALCTALQLINFVQDVTSDLQERDRCYLPLADMEAFNVQRSDLSATPPSPALQALLAFQLTRAETFLKKGMGLKKTLTGFFGFEARLILMGGQAMLNILYHRRHSLHRPQLRAWQWPFLILKALISC